MRGRAEGLQGKFGVGVEVAALCLLLLGDVWLDNREQAAKAMLGP